MIFLSESSANLVKATRLQNQLGFSGMEVVECSGHSGGLILLWDSSIDVEVIHSNVNFIDVKVKVAGFEKWRLIGFYGHPNRNK